MPTRAFTIRKLALTAGVGVEAIRHYQRLGLLAEPARVVGGFRCYSAEHARRLSFIRRARDLGFSLNDIAGLISLSAERDRARIRELTRNRISQLRGRIAKLESMVKAMEKLSTQCARAKTRTRCPIIAALVDYSDEHEATTPHRPVRSRAIPGKPHPETRHRRNAMAEP